MIKIAHLIDGRTKTGAILSVKRIMKNYSFNDSKLILVSYGAPISSGDNINYEIDYINLIFPKLLSKFVSAPLKRIYLLPILLVAFFFDIPKLGRYCEKNQIDCLHLHHFQDIFQYGFLSRKNIKIISHIRAIVNRKLFGGIPYKLFRKYVYNNSNQIIGISQATLSALNLKDNSKSTIIYNGLEGLDATDHNAISKVKQGSFVVGSVIRFSKLKGIDLFFDTFFKYFESNPQDDVKFLLVAPSGNNDALDLRSELFNRVIDAGLSEKLIYFEYFPDYSYIMPYIDILYHTTLQREGFGNVVLEANWFGKPAISTPCQGVNDIIINGESGYIMNSYEAVEACKLIKTLYDNASMYNDFSQNAFAQAHLDKFNMSETINKLHSIYVNVK